MTNLLSKMILTVILAAVGSGVLAATLGFVLPENATEAMKSVIAADAALVGFMGVITVFILTTFQNEGRWIEEIESRKNDLSNSYRIGIQNDHTKELAKANSHDLVILGKKQDLINDFFKDFFNWVVLTVLLLICSILLALYGMSQNDSIRYFGIVSSIFSLACGLFSMVLTLTYYNDTFGRLRMVKNQ